MKRDIKKLTLALFLTVGLSGSTWSAGGDSLGVIGDNLDLQAVLGAFKDAATVSDFENSINNPESKINNLDLNEDNAVDYIQVIDLSEGDIHAIVLRIDVTETESQDIAVIEIEKTAANEATLQIVGDADIYGENYIVEAIETSSFGNMPPALIIVNVWAWPSIRFIYGPTYKPWRSPWRWQHYPTYWKPRKPYRWRTYNGFHTHRHQHSHIVHVKRSGNARKVYHKNRKTWKHINHHSNHHNNHHNGHKNHNKSTKVNKNTKVKSNGNGGKKKVSKTKKTQKGQKQTKTKVGSNGNKTQKKKQNRSSRR